MLVWVGVAGAVEIPGAVRASLPDLMMVEPMLGKVDESRATATVTRDNSRRLPPEGDLTVHLKDETGKPVEGRRMATSCTPGCRAPVELGPPLADSSRHQ
jgi:hypothetical protein